MDLRQVGASLMAVNPAWLVVSVGLIIPITALRAIRFYWVAPAGALPGIMEAFRLTFLASALNLFVPAKGGDLAKSYFITRQSDTSAGVAIAIVVYERLCDLFGLIACCLLGWVIGRPQVPGLPTFFWWILAAIGIVSLLLVASLQAAEWWRALVIRLLPHRRFGKIRELAQGWPDLLQRLHGRRVGIVLFSPVLWFTHLFQIWLFTVALSAPIPFTICASLAALVLMAGQTPFTFAGLGARDAALVLLLSRYISPESAAAMGILTATRNLLPPLIGLPLMWRYLSSMVEARRSAGGLEEAH
jgi:uncharacterized protein (TIRG00374 family)